MQSHPVSLYVRNVQQYPTEQVYCTAKNDNFFWQAEYNIVNCTCCVHFLFDYLRSWKVLRCIQWGLWYDIHLVN